MSLKIAIGSDHAGYDYKNIIIDLLHELEHEVKDFGTHSTASVDYPDFAHPVATSVESEEYTLGILICGTANGVAITANKHQKIRAAIAWTEEVAALVRQHNDANILCVPARFVDQETAKNIVKTFLTTTFEGGRHADRIGKIVC